VQDEPNCGLIFEFNLARYDPEWRSPRLHDTRTEKLPPRDGREG